MSNVQFWKFCNESKWGIVLITVLVLLGALLSYQFISIKSQEWKDYLVLVDKGSRVRGKILKHQFFREINADETKRRGSEGFNVEIKYFDEFGCEQRIFETWKSDGKLNPDDLKGQDIIVYYSPHYRRIQAASENNPGIQNAVRWREQNDKC